MKRISLLLVVFLLISALSLTISASEKDASLSVSSRTTESGNIFIFAAITDIKSNGGISYLEYSIKYDPKILELKNSMVNMPDTWGSDAEDWSSAVSDGEYIWAVFNVEVGNTVKEDNQLFIELEFTPLTDNAVTAISFECIDVRGDDLLSPLSGKSVELEISLSKDADDNFIVSDSPIIDIGDESENDNNSISNDNDNTTNSNQANEGTNGSNNGNGQNTENSENTPHVGVELNGNSNDDNGINSTAVIIVAVVLVFAGAGIAAFFFIRSKKGD